MCRTNNRIRDAPGKSVPLTSAVDDSLYRKLGDEIAGHRRQAEMTQEELGERVRLSRTSIVNIEKGRQRVALHHLYAIADALQVDLRKILPPSDDPALQASADREEWVAEIESYLEEESV